MGLVQENSQVGAIRIELLADSGVRVGTLLAVVDGEETVFYQVVKGLTREEAFDGLHFGSRVATATQIGTLEGSQFRKFRWLPPMNAPVFLADPEVHEPVSTDFVLGTIPESTIKVSGNFAEEFQMHTAILGATGTGKTEFAFDVIRHAVGAGVRVLCIDLTAQYRQRLGDLRIEALSVSERQEEHLSKNFRAIETGEYGGFKEKAAFDQFASPIEAEVATRLGNFIASSESDLGLLELTAVSNTKATLWITEQYLRSLLELGRSGRLERPVLVVVEEAHTVMPEMNFVGDGSYDTRGTIARISQIALQGRKYGIGLLVIAQRTATVSKSVLTQCNTVISFSCMDETSIAYLSNVFGSEVAETLPQLPRRHAVAYGPWVRSESPIAFEVPFDEQKAQRPTFAASRVEPPNHPEEPTAEGVGWFPEEPPF